mgnify:CR=1 FL=1
MNIILESYQSDVETESETRSSKVQHVIDCQEDLKTKLFRIRFNLKLNPDNHEYIDLYHLMNRIEKLMRESIQLILLEETSIKSMMFFRNKCLEDIMKHRSRNRRFLSASGGF